ncbi:pyridoxal-dependent decarboxylase, exosortase A system-associated [Sphingomicrobium aestuariivivum]|nr:pyridoxal-dependent decarboxylase, exosortase A system-associated [Sphingomicrobium aestuariivivum]MCJ8190066.1 pyridoxal-dependent decarboxylase, exosortase A system-associated [Sphingomicrobium aestuariivivum]
MGGIPAGFVPAPNGALEIERHPVGYWIEKAGGTPLFLYDVERVEAQVAAFRAAMPSRIALHYAVKSNPFGPLLDRMAALVDGFDLASRGEIARVAHHDLPKSIAGPGKSIADHEAALRAGAVVHVESEGEAQRLCDVATHIGIRPKVAIRVNPPFLLKGAGMKMGGLASAFGVDAERVPNLVAYLVDQDCDFRGYHVYAGSQSLSEDAIVAAQKATLDLVVELTGKTGVIPAEVNLGGGFGIPYYSGETPLSLRVIGDGLAQALKGLPGSFADTKLIIELGRWLVGEAGVYLTRILDMKESGGQIFATTDGGLQHMLAATGNFGQFLRRNYPVINASRMTEEADTVMNVVGRLCTPLDLLGDQVALPADTQVGDVIAIFCAGAYGLTASPHDFLSQPKALEMLAQSKG